MLYMNVFVSNFEFLAETRKFFKRIARREYWSNWNVTYQWMLFNELYKLMESFFSYFELVFEMLAENL